MKNSLGQFVGEAKSSHFCLLCTSPFLGYKSDNQKYCSKICYWASLRGKLKIGRLSNAEKAKRHRVRHRSKYHNLCQCGKEKYIKSKTCRACGIISRSGELSPYYKGGYENHLKHNRQRAQKIKILGGHTEREWAELKEKCGNACVSCRRGDVGLTRDHILPISKGGSDDIENIQPLCSLCNSQKYTKFINYLELLEKDKVGELK